MHFLECVRMIVSFSVKVSVPVLATQSDIFLWFADNGSSLEFSILNGDDLNKIDSTNDHHETEWGEVRILRSNEWYFQIFKSIPN